ncbi:MAG: phosphoglucosamine mutase [Rhodospirillaceae bacterium]
MTARRLFGTDGVRGTANREPMTAATALKIGMAAGRQFQRGEYRHTVVIGKDTRLSCYMLEQALTAGFTSVGMDVLLTGPLPTPAVAKLTRSMRADLGVMISASHNPYEDNGIKLFGPDGYKLSDGTEAAIEALVGNGVEAALVEPARLGRVRRLEDASGRYIEYVKSTFPSGRRLDGLKIVLDCANGAAYRVAPTILWELGAEVVPIGVTPDGMNINARCGAMYPQALSRAVVEEGANLGIALDGDADRVVLCDERGREIDGDQVLGLIGGKWAQSGELTGGGIVATVMSNLGLERFLAAKKLHMRRTQVGDRYVVEAMRDQGYNLGGEQSGHVILGNYSTTGDGLAAALQVLAALVEDGGLASEVLHVFDPLPQVLKNVRFKSRDAAKAALSEPDVAAALAEAETRLAGGGRLLIRSSGTEPVIRVMAEGEDEGAVKAVVDWVVSVFETKAA